MISTHDRQTAVDRAVALVGRAYRLDADGPDAFDCSAVTRHSWLFPRANGMITLPHNSSEQMHYTRHESRFVEHTRFSRMFLRDGDLCFYAPHFDRLGNPIGCDHVNIYVGRDPASKQRMCVNGTGDDQGIERIGIDQYGKPFGYLFVGH